MEVQQIDTPPVIIANSILPIHKDILVSELYFGEQITASGIVILDDDKKDQGIHPRWAKVYAVGPEDRSGVKPGQWILVEHGRWSRGVYLRSPKTPHDSSNDITIRRVDPKCILLVTDKNPDPKNACFMNDSIL